MSRILLENMIFYGYHGHLAEESRLGQRFLINLALTVDTTEAAATDDLSKTVDYTKIHALCREQTEDRKYRLIETLGERILTEILKKHPRVLTATITIKKPSAPIAGVLEYVGIECTKTR